MKRISVALKAHLALPQTTLATCVQLTRQDGTVVGFTDHDETLTVTGWVAPDDVLNGTYSPTTGYTASSIATGSVLDVDTMEITGPLQSPSITDATLQAGVWDYARFRVFRVNWRDLTMGPLWGPTGRLGEVNVERGQFRAELRGLMQNYETTVGELYSPFCRANLGDTRCTVALGPLTVTGTLTGVSSDGLTLYDTGRTEPGPTGGVNILTVVLGNPTRFDFSGTVTFYNGEPILVRGILGPTVLNTLWTVRSFNGSNLFYIDVDSSALPAYVSGGIVTPLRTSGTFDGGVLTMTSGPASGLRAEVKAYVPGVLALHLPFPYTVAVGNTYSLTPGCDKSLATCRDRYSNLVNFRGEPYLPGIDRVIQTGRHT